MQTKACGQGNPSAEDEPLWDEKLPRIVDKGQHGLLDPSDPIQSLACYYNTHCMMIFFPFQKCKFYRIKINKTVEIIQMYHTISANM